MSRYTDFPGPQDLRARGTVIVVPGRGETRGVYARLATRLAADAYHVRVVDPDALTELPDTTTLPRPLVLLGADSGAAAIAALVARGDTTAPWWPDAVVLAGIPGPGVTASWDDELAVRTSCPVHQAVLRNEAERGTLSTPIPDTLLQPAYESTSPVPRLVLIGELDPLADREALARAVKSAPTGRLSVVRGAHHDVLNDRQHRSVAAEIVNFLETVGNELVPVIEVESSAW